MVEDVGILAVEFYMPTQYVEQTDLEQYDGVSKGKYTIGLGQHRMGFCADCEDAISMAMTVVRRMLDKHNVDVSQIGRLEVGTESGVDRSKSIKSYLMQLFGDNHDVIGLDTVQACFGGTQALFNAVDWLTSAAWDGRLALVVASDVAAYPPGPARPTGGAGAVALLLGPNAPLVIEPRLRSIYSAHCYDFYKPDPKSEYPIVDGSLSITSYINAALQCYQGLTKKFEKLKNIKFSLKDSCGVLFHSPYTRLVEKTFAKLVESDVRHKLAPENVDQLVRETPEFSASNGHVNGIGDSLASSPKSVQQPSKELQAASKELFDSLTSPSLWLAREIGNMYTPSLYACLVSFLASYQLNGHGNDRRLLLFSYGSGLASAMFSIQLKVFSPAFEQLCDKLSMDVKAQLNRRRCMAPDVLVASLERRHSNFGVAPLHDTGFENALAAGLVDSDVFVLESIDDRFRRNYVIVPPPVAATPSPDTIAAKVAAASNCISNKINGATSPSEINNGIAIE